MPTQPRGLRHRDASANGDLLFVEVEGRVAGASDFVLTNSEIIAALNNVERHILALVEVAADDTTTVRYLEDSCTGRMTESGYGEQKRPLSWPDYWNLAGPAR